MSLLKVCFTVAVIASIVIDQGNARPRAKDMMKNTIKKNSAYREELEGNNTEKRVKVSKNAHPTNDAPKNSDIIKAIDDNDYDEDYDAPIIEIRFKRDTSTSIEEVENAFEQWRKSIMNKKKLLRRFTRWSREHHLN